MISLDQTKKKEESSSSQNHARNLRLIFFVMEDLYKGPTPSNATIPPQK